MSNHTDNTSKTAIKQVMDSFLLSCKVEGKSYGIIKDYANNNSCRISGSLLQEIGVPKM